MNMLVTKIRLYIIRSIACIVLSLGSISSAYSVDFALDIHGGTNGIGIGGTVGINPFVNVRAGINSYEKSQDYVDNGVEYTADLDLDNQYVLLDIHPFANTFRITLGLYSNDNSIQGRSSLGTTTIGNGANTVTFDAGNAIIGLEYESSTAPYIGIGFGNAVNNNGGFGFAVDLGIIDTGSFVATADLDSDARTSAAAFFSQAQIDSAIAAEVNDVNDEFSDFDAWPLLQIGISYGF